jgi:ElaB/YqjD/DUF883 family membrane-anchored ribosome-binding protein
METTTSNHGQDLADAAKARVGRFANSAAQRAGAEAKSLGDRLDSVTDMASQACDAVSNASSTIAEYTKKNPAKALGIAAAVGIVAYALIRQLTPSRD